MPDYDLINLDRYVEEGYDYQLYSPKRNAPIWVTRGCPYNIGTGIDYSIKELADVISGIIGFDGAIEWDTTKPDGVH